MRHGQRLAVPGHQPGAYTGCNRDLRANRDSNRRAVGITDTGAYRFTQPQTDSKRITDPYPAAHRDTDSDRDADSHRHGYTNRDSNADPNADCNSHRDPGSDPHAGAGRLPADRFAGRADQRHERRRLCTQRKLGRSSGQR